jgi:hypothetical protein
VSCETGNLQAKVRKLSLENSQLTSNIPEVPAQMKEVNQKYLQELNSTFIGPNKRKTEHSTKNNVAAELGIAKLYALST